VGTCALGRQEVERRKEEVCARPNCESHRSQRATAPPRWGLAATEVCGAVAAVGQHTMPLGLHNHSNTAEVAARIDMLDERTDTELGPRRGRLRRTLLQLMLMRIREGKRQRKRKGAARRGTKTAVTQKVQRRGKVRVLMPLRRWGWPPLLSQEGGASCLPQGR